MNNLHFAEPQWFHLFWGVVSLLLVMVWLERRLGRDLSKFMHPILQSRLVKNKLPFRKNGVGLPGKQLPLTVLVSII